jgi:NADPH:quinone reductase-like Zn-dependent oxidoreductase
MKAIVMRQYGGPEVLKFEDAPDPVAGPGQVLLRVAATSVNPLDIARRSGTAQGFFPVQFPGIIGADVSGTIMAIGPEVENFSTGDQVFGMAHQSYAELCVAPAANLTKVPDGLKLEEAAALPLVTLTGHQLITGGTRVKAGDVLFVAGAAGSVGRSAVFTAKALGATVIAGVLKRHLAQAGELHADRVVATDDEEAMALLRELDAVADAVNGKTATQLISKVKKGGVFGTVLAPPSNSGEYPGVEIVRVRVHPDPVTLSSMAQAVVNGELIIPISGKLPLSRAAEAHVAVQRRVQGKLLLVADNSLLDA